MSKKDKRMFLIICVVTSILLSLLMNEIYFRVRYGSYIFKAYQNSEEAVKALNKLDSLYIIN